MSSKISKWSLLWPVLLLALLPLGVGYFVYPEHLPPGFGVFPPQLIDKPPYFWLPYFIVVAVLAAAVVALYLFPKLFGFKGVQFEPRKPSTVSYPWWFYAGGVVMVISWYLMWARPESLASIVPYVFSPLWWGFIIMLDGVVYKRTDGASWLGKSPKSMLICAAVSLIGWLFFEYFDYFVNESWYYPNMQVLSHKLTVLVFLIAYTTVWPAVFEWYALLTTFPGLVARFQNGPKWNVSGPWAMIIGFLLMIGMVIWPLMLFWAVWVGPTLVFIGLLLWCKVKNPADGLASGNWAPVLLIMLACILNGFIWEFWNYGSMHPVDPVMNPNYWVYNIPYVNVIHIYSEMPLLGYFGYMPFGILVWQFYIWAGELFGFDSKITFDE
jgi:hypothetical protein